MYSVANGGKSWHQEVISTIDLVPPYRELTKLLKELACM